MSIRLFALTALAGVILVLFPPAIARAQGDGVQSMQWQGDRSQTAQILGLSPDAVSNLGVLLEEFVTGAELQLELNADSETLRDAVERHWHVATTTEAFEGQASILARIALLRSQLTWRLEGPERALEEALQALMPLVEVRRVGASVKLPEHFVPATSAGLELAAVALADERLVALREVLRKELSQKPGDDEILEAVRDAVESNNSDFVLSIGERARPFIEQLCLEDPDQMIRHVNYDPLGSLIALGPTNAALFLLQNLDAGGYLWHQRILNILQDNNLLKWSDSWADSTSQEIPPVCLVREWLEVLARLLENPDLASATLQILEPVFERDALTPELCAALGRTVALGRPDFDRQLLATLGKIDYRLTSIQPLLETCLASSNTTLRRYAADQLALVDHSEPLLALVSDLDPRIRLAVARSLGTTDFLYPVFSGGRQSDVEWGYTRPASGEIERGTLAQLARDADPGVRKAAVYSMEDLDEPLEVEVYRRLLTDPDEDIRARLLRFDYRNQPFETEVLIALGDDSSEDVRERVAMRLRDRTWSETDEALVPVLLELQGRGTGVDLAARIHAIYRTRFAFPAVVRWALERGESDWLFNCVQFLHASLPARGRPVSAALELLTEDEFQRLFLWALGDARAGTNMENMLSRIDPAQLTGLHGLVARTDLPMDVRLVAARYSYLSRDQSHADDILTLLSDPAWSGRALSDPERQALGNFAEVLVQSGKAEVLLRVVQDERVSDPIGLAMAMVYPREGALGREIALAILARWFTEDSPTSFAVTYAIEHLGALPDDATPALLRRAVQHPGYARSAVLAVQQLRRPQYLGVLELALKGDGLPGDVRAQVQPMAAQALVGFPSDEAVELLLKGYGWVTSDTARTNIDNALTKIRNYREQLAWWEEEQQSLPTVNDARIELFGMLDSEKPLFRAEAARSLAALGALEALPRLILLLEDPDENVREAARAALDRLQASGGDSPGVSAEATGGD